MIQLFRIPSIVMLLAHLIVGCCFCHVRACAHERMGMPIPNGPTITAPGSRCGCVPDPRQPRHCRDREYYLAAPRRSIESFCGLVVPAPAPAPTAALPLLSAPRVSEQLNGASDRALTVRLHLAHQVLLI